MSGGSYDYLYISSSLDELLDKRRALQEMADRLEGLDEVQFPGVTAAARETAYVLNLIRAWETHVVARVALVSDVWHAVEWWDSNDYSADQVREALVRLVQPTPEATAAPVGEALSIPEEWKAPSPRLAPPTVPAQAPRRDDRPPFRPPTDPWPTAED